MQQPADNDDTVKNNLLSARTRFRKKHGDALLYQPVGGCSSDSDSDSCEEPSTVEERKVCAAAQPKAKKCGKKAKREKMGKRVVQ